MKRIVPILFPLLLLMGAAIVLQLKLTNFSNRETVVPTNTPNVIVLPLTPAPIKTPTPKPYIMDGGKLFNLVNSYRAKKGLSQMTWNLKLCEYSKNRNTEVKQDWSHDGFQEDAQRGGGLWEACPNCARAGENLSKGNYTEQAILNAWINSPSHHATLLDPTWDIGCSMISSNSYSSFIFGDLK